MSRFVKATALVAGAACGLGLAIATTANAQIKWRSGVQGIGANAAPADADTVRNELVRLAARPDASRVLVALSGIPSDAERAALAANGVTLGAYVGQQTFFATLSDNPTGITRMPSGLSIDQVAEIRPEHKADRYILDNNIPAHALREVPQQGAQNDATGTTQLVATYVMLHRDAALDDAEALVEFYNGTIVDRLISINALVVEVPRENLLQLATEDMVKWTEIALPQFSTLNAENRQITQVNEVQSLYGLTGSGVSVMVYDGSAAISNHQDFTSPFGGQRLFVRDSSGSSNHATHTSGTVAGNGSLSGGNNRGMAPNALIQSYGFEFSGGGTFLYSNPGDLEQDYNQAINTYDAVISNNSIGTNTAPNGFDCDITGDYGVTSNLIDSIVRGSLGAPMRIVWSNGNERQTSRCGNQYNTTAPPACAKNHLTVGALNSNDDSMTSFSSWGPTDDGRMKPDLSGPGCQSNGDGGVTSTGSNGNYSTLCGTSMSGPTVAGIGALLIQDYKVQFAGQPLFRNSTLRMLLCHTAADLGNTGPDNQFGYGSVRAKDAIDFMRTGNFVEAEVTNGGAWSTSITVAPGTSEFKATIAWDDFPATPNVAVALVNDLDLVVTDPNGVRRYPWTLSPINPGAPAAKNAPNTRDNIEQVQVDNPAPGVWSIQVVGTSVPEGPQTFSIGVEPGLTAGSISVTSELPDLVLPGETVDITVAVNAINQSIVPGSVTLFTRSSASDPFTPTPMTPLGGNAFGGTAPGANCDDTIEFYVQAEGTETGIFLAPGNAPASVFSIGIGEIIVPVSDDFEVNSGWVIGVPDDDATTGIWSRNNPEGTTAQPEDAFSGANCWVTDYRAGTGAGSWDIDNGKTTLTSPVFDLTGIDNPVLSYSRWYSNNAGAAPNADVFEVFISNNGGASWTELETVGPGGPGTSGGWIPVQFNVEDFVVPTNNVRLRFVASDEGEGSLVEAAIDLLQVTAFQCDPIIVEPECDEDLTGDGSIDSDDLGLLLGAFGTSSAGDIDGDGDTDSDDLGLLLSAFGSNCE
ncbi:MAG: S8 family serine peptidase [Phycisphaerales bacterium]